jgi:hypothetical protein
MPPVREPIGRVEVCRWSAGSAAAATKEPALAGTFEPQSLAAGIGGPTLTTKEVRSAESPSPQS